MAETPSPGDVRLFPASVFTCPSRFDEGDLLPKWLAGIVGFSDVYLARRYADHLDVQPIAISQATGTDITGDSVYKSVRYYMDTLRRKKSARLARFIFSIDRQTVAFAVLRVYDGLSIACRS